MEWLEYHDEPVKLHSGGRSHWLVRGDLIFADERLREAVLALWERCLRHAGGGSWLVLGVPRGGVPWAKALAERIGGTYCEPDAEVPEEGEAVVVDDVLTTGGSLEGFRPDIPVRVSLVVVERGRARAGGAWMRVSLPLLPEANQ